MSFENPFKKPEAPKTPDSLSIGGVNIPLDKLKYQLELGGKRSILMNQLPDYALKYEILKEEFEGIMNSVPQKVSSLIRVYGLGFEDVFGSISPENMKGLIEGRNVDQLLELMDFGLESLMKEFKSLVAKLEDDPENNNIEVINNFMKTTTTPNFSFSIRNNLAYSQYSEINENEWSKIQAFISGLDEESSNKIQTSKSSEELIANLIEISNK